MRKFIYYWEFDDGQPKMMGSGPFSHQVHLDRGYRCWAYTHCDDHIEGGLRQWMRENMSGKYECHMKFNSGNPIYLVYIAEDDDAIRFKLQFGEYFA